MCKSIINLKFTLTSHNISLSVSQHLLKKDDKIFENAFFHEYFTNTSKKLSKFQKFIGILREPFFF